MVCIGGFHEAGPRSNPSSAVGGIAIFYADRGANWNNLVEQLGTIDFKERAEAGSGALAVTRGDAVQPIARVDDPVPVDEK